MATKSSKSTSSAKKTSSPSKSNSSAKSRAKTANSGAKRNYTKKKTAYDYKKESELFHEIGLVIFFIAMVILFLCNFGLIGPVGAFISDIMFGLFGTVAFILPIGAFVAVCFWFANEGNPNAIRKIISGCVLFVMLGCICELFANNALELTKYDLIKIYDFSSYNRNGGGVLSGSICYILHKYLGMVGSILIILLLTIISFILMTERNLISDTKDRIVYLFTRSRERSERHQEYVSERRQEAESRRLAYEEKRDAKARKEEEKYTRQKNKELERKLKQEELENEKILRMDKPVSGVMTNTKLSRNEVTDVRGDIHEITWNENDIPVDVTNVKQEEFNFDNIRIRSAHQVNLQPNEGVIMNTVPMEPVSMNTMPMEPVQAEVSRVERTRPTAKAATGSKETVGNTEITKDIEKQEKKIPKKYIFPPLSRLQKSTSKVEDSTQELKETALRLQQTLHTFGVRVTITDISQGPSVTRYELQPEQGVKVSKILSLADDIKLNLAATDIRIEAPIPGKAAIGIEVPNKENMAVSLRDLLETKEFREFSSNLAFAVGKDIAGQTIVADIAKMPHMLIAGATGSGKSVCINTLIMSILYKAHPDDVKLIMIDPKVVELSVYNGIPHLLIPVVTDPKKASAALQWAVKEMDERYQKFSDFNVRDLKSYNQKVESMHEMGDDSAPRKLPQIVVIVDELADLMMVAPGEVEGSICRLAQLARAAGIHLIIATQRPSVDVITGLIKANMPSRVAFSVSSGVDSRTILDMNGAEKLLGKGDMLFYPQGYTKPARIQGAFVSDKEVADVVDFLKNQALGNVYAEDIEEKIKNLGSSSSLGGGGGADDRDEYFEEAGRFIIDKDKASIGMLQRVFKIGFNRAARIMDQLCEYGVVGEEEGTKPRKVLMTMDEFENLLEEI